MDQRIVSLPVAATPELPPVVFDAEDFARCAAGKLSWRVVYGANVTDSHGCGGTTVSYQVLFDEPVELGALTEMRAAAQAAATERRQFPAAGAAMPRWCTEFEGTRADYDAAMAAWRQLSAAAASEALEARNELWVQLGAQIMTFDSVILNDLGPVSFHPGYAPVLGVDREHGCRCAHSGSWIADPDTLAADIAAGEREAWESHTPPLVLAETACGSYLMWDVPDGSGAHPDSVRIRGALAAAAQRWAELEARYRGDAARAAAATADAAALKAAMADMGYREWVAAEEELKALNALRWRVLGGEDAAAVAFSEALGEHNATVVLEGTWVREDTGWLRKWKRTAAVRLAGRG